MILRDPYDRPLLNLRISVNHECNLNCFFCHAEGYYIEDKELMTPKDIGQLVEILTEFGIKSVKLTGGEPLLRDDLEEIVAQIRRVRRVEDIGLTTNGVLLEDRIQSLIEAGLDRINVNIPYLDKEVYRRITGADVLEKVLRGVEKSLSAGIKRLKINRVMLKGLNDMELDPLIEFAASIGADVQLIELQDKNPNSPLLKKYSVNFAEIEEIIREKAISVEIRQDMHDRPVYDLGDVKVELVRSMRNPDFCYHCTKMRVTHFGAFKTCLLSNASPIYFLDELRSGNRDEVVNLLFKALSEREPYFKCSEALCLKTASVRSP